MAKLVECRMLKAAAAESCGIDLKIIVVKGRLSEHAGRQRHGKELRKSLDRRIESLALAFNTRRIQRRLTPTSSVVHRAVFSGCLRTSDTAATAAVGRVHRTVRNFSADLISL